MPFIGPDGRIVERRSPWRFSIVYDFFRGIYDFLDLFFSALINPPQLGGNAPRSTYADRHQGRSHRTPRGGSGTGTGKALGGSNIRGVKNLQGTTNCAAGG